MIDKYGLYVEEDGDGGDCPHRCGIMLTYLSLNKNIAEYYTLLKNVYNNLQVSTDVYIRNPDRWNQPDDFSRDQASRLMLSINRDSIKGYYKKVVKNLFRHQNGDFMGLGEPANIIRSLSVWPLYPFLLISDIKFLGDLIARKYNSWGYDCLFLPDLLLAVKKYPTPFAYLACKLYAKSDAEAQITRYLLAPSANGCKEAGEAMLAMFKMIKEV